MEDTHARIWDLGSRLPRGVAVFLFFKEKTSGVASWTEFSSTNEKRPAQLLCVRCLKTYALRFRFFTRDRMSADQSACAFTNPNRLYARSLVSRSIRVCLRFVTLRVPLRAIACQLICPRVHLRECPLVLPPNDSVVHLFSFPLRPLFPPKITHPITEKTVAFAPTMKISH